MRRKLYSHAKNLSKIKRPLDMLGGEKHPEWVRNADIIPDWHDIRNTYMNELGDIAKGGYQNDR